jgi:Zn-finger nucleic acid-binding protein
LRGEEEGGQGALIGGAKGREGAPVPLMPPAFAALIWEMSIKGRANMKCPVCSKEMVQENFGVNVDVCENGCKGIWFDQGELRRLDENNEGLGAALEQALRYPRSNDGQRGQLTCPKCAIPMHTHKYKRDQEVNVDECYQCGGIFLDSGELTEIRNNYLSDAQVKAYTDKIITSAPEYVQGMKEWDAEKKRVEARVEAIQKYAKFMTVNYWRQKFS